MTKKTKKPWPTKKVMEQIYDLNLWGGKDYDFYSGFGSHDNEIIKPYIETVITFLKSFENPITVCDLGCGDFNIGKHLTKYAKKYIAVDIVNNLIERNKTIFKEANLEFHCLNIVKDKIPNGDCIILRQVLQHLSNSEIQCIVKKIPNYKYLIVTEHLPLHSFYPNKDIISGQGIRLKQHSGVNLLQPPFNLNVQEEKVINEHNLENNLGHIVTTMYRLF